MPASRKQKAVLGAIWFTKPLTVCSDNLSAYNTVSSRQSILKRKPPNSATPIIKTSMVNTKAILFWGVRRNKNIAMLAIKNPMADNGFMADGGSHNCLNPVISNCHPINTSNAMAPTAMIRYFDQLRNFCCKTVSMGNCIPMLNFFVWIRIFETSNSRLLSYAKCFAYMPAKLWKATIQRTMTWLFNRTQPPFIQWILIGILNLMKNNFLNHLSRK